MKQKIRQYAGAVLCVTLLGTLAWFAVTYREQIWLVLTQQSARDAFAEYVRGSGISGFFAFLGLQVLQVVVAVLPGEPVELMAGALFGTWGGLGVCMLGLLMGSVMVYYLIRLFGANGISPETLHKYRFLRDDAHVHFALFLLYFIPGTPKDMLLYVGPFLPVKPAMFFAIATFARIPSVITSTYAGANLMQGDWRTAVAVFLVTGAAAGLCVWKQEKILAWLRARRKGKGA